MKKILFLLCCILILSGCSQDNEKFVIINNIEIKVEIADTAELRYKGLINKKELCDNCGMLFIFPEKEIRTFVMRDMNFALDMIWIDDDKIIKINKNTIPEGNNPVMRYSSDMPVNYVLEVNGGFCEENGIEAGDGVELGL